LKLASRFTIVEQGEKFILVIDTTTNNTTINHASCMFGTKYYLFSFLQI